jgi:hypothetical protein
MMVFLLLILIMVQVKLHFIINTYDSVTARHGSDVIGSESKDYVYDNAPYVLAEQAKDLVNQESGGNWKEAAMDWRLEIVPDNGVLDYTIYVYDEGESIPGTQPNVTWDAINERLVLDGTIPTPDPTPSAPVLQAIGNKSVDEGSLLAFTATSTDADGDDVVHTMSGTPSGASFVDQGDNTADFSWTPGSGDAGVYPVTVTGRDETDRVDFESFTITVNDVTVPEAPVWTQVENQTVYGDVPMSFVATVTDDDTACGSLTLSGDTIPTGSSVQDNGDCTATFSWTPSSAQSSLGGTVHEVTLEADDATYQVTMTMYITVLAIDEYPIMDTIYDREVTVGEDSFFRGYRYR